MDRAMSTASIPTDTLKAYDEHKISIAELCKRLGTDLERGLTKEEAASRLGRNGYNILTPAPQKSEILRFFGSLFQGFSILLWISAALCISVYFIQFYIYHENDLEHIWLAIALISVVFITGWFSFYQEGKSSKIMKSFLEMIPEDARIIRSGISDTIPAKNIVVGDLIVLQSGDKIPADLRIVQSEELCVDNCALTGESEPMLRSPEDTQADPLETKNLAFFATFAVQGTGKGIVIRIGDDTLMGQIADLTSHIKPKPTVIAREIGHFMRIITIHAFITGIIIFVIALTIGEAWMKAVVYLVGIITGNVPEGLVATMTLCLRLSSKRMAQKNCLVKKLEAVESLGCTSIICSDKTGTLTQNRMTVTQMWYDYRIVGVHQSGRGISTKEQKSEVFRLLARCAVLCSRAEFKPNQNLKTPIGKREVVGDASEAAILKCMELTTRNVKGLRKSMPKVFEMPFNSERKFQFSIHSFEKQFILVMKGAPERILEKCSLILTQSGDFQISNDIKDLISQACKEFASNGGRVLAFCDLPKPFDFKKDSFEAPTIGYRFLGLMSLIDPPRPNVPDAILRCRRAGIKVIMVTGDHPLTATSVARSVHIISDDSVVGNLRDLDKKPDAVIIEGKELSSTNNEDLDYLVTNFEELVFARTSPKQKLQIVESCQRTGAVVAVTGDGVNDSPALKKADVGVAMGISGSGVSKQSADIILLDDNFSTIVNGIEEGRLVFDNLKKSISYTLSHSIPEIFPFLLHIGFGIPLPLSVIGILCIDLGTDMWPAIAYAYEPAESDLMMRKPRNVKRDRLVTPQLLLRCFGLIGIIESVAATFSFFVLYADNGWLPQQLLGIRLEWPENVLLTDSYGYQWDLKGKQMLQRAGYTAYFVGIITCQVVNAFTTKTQRNSIFTPGNCNWTLNFAVLSSLVLTILIIYIPGVSAVFQMYPLYAHWWIPSLPFAVLILILDEFRKCLIRRNPERCNFLAKETIY